MAADSLSLAGNSQVGSQHFPVRWRNGVPPECEYEMLFRKSNFNNYYFDEWQVHDLRCGFKQQPLAIDVDRPLIKLVAKPLQVA